MSWSASLSARRAWIEIRDADGAYIVDSVALRKESVDRNSFGLFGVDTLSVALRKESVDRNQIRIAPIDGVIVALRKESVDRNSCWLLA